MINKGKKNSIIKHNFKENDYYNQSFKEEDDNESLSYVYKSILPFTAKNLEDNFYNSRNLNNIYEKK